MHDSQHQRKTQLATIDLQRETHSMSMEVGGLVEVITRVMGFRGHAGVVEPAHLREAVAQEIVATARDI